MKKLLFILIFIIIFSSCGNNETQNQNDLSTTTKQAETESVNQTIKPKLPEIYYENTEFIFLNGNVQEWMTVAKVTTDEETGDALNDSIFARNRAVEEQFNVKITETQTSSVKADATKSIAAGDNSFHVILLTMADAFALALENYTIDFAEIPYLGIYNYESDYETSNNSHMINDCPWWIKNSFTDMSIANKSYFGISLFDTTHFDGVRTLFFNKQMIQDYILENPYELVNTGAWTIDKMLEMGLKVASDVNGNGVDDEGDKYGYTSWESISGQSLMAGVGAPLSVDKDKDDLPYFTLDQEHFVSRYEAIFDLLNNNAGFKNPFGESGNHGGVNQFISGDVLFYNETMSNTKNLREMDTDFGILPMPKYNEAQSEYYMVAGNPYFMSVPITNNELEMTGIISEALAFESMDTVSAAFYDILLMGKVARDNDSEKMLDIIFNSLSFYHPIALTYVNGNVTKMLWTGNSDIVSYFSSNRKVIENEIQNVINTFNN